MAYGNDVSVFVEDSAGDQGAPASPAPWWLSPDVDIPATPGEARPGVNQVQIRVHLHEEPFLEEKVVAEVYAGDPSLVLSPTVGTRRIDPGNLRFRPAGVTGSEPVADLAGGTLMFDWTPSSAVTDPAGPGHRCLVVRAFPESVTPPTGSFDVPNEQHEAQHNITVLETTSKGGGKGGDGTKGKPLDPDELTGLWKKEILTRAIGRKGPRIVVWAFDPRPDEKLELLVRRHFRRRFFGFSEQPPDVVTLGPGPTGKKIDPVALLSRKRFARQAGLGKGLFAKTRLQTAARIELGPKRGATLGLNFDHSNLRPRTAVVLHGAQWDEKGRPEGGITVVALAPTE